MKTNVFRISNTKEKAVYPPEQVFLKLDFHFMLTKGGHITENEFEYKKLMNCLRKLNEKYFCILENLGTIVTLTERKAPFYAKMSVSSNLSDFNNIVDQFDPPFGFHINDFFIYGQNEGWGIYICECPTINIIGCKKELTQVFSEVFNIKGNGFDEQKDFISLEYQRNPNMIQTLINNYHL